MGSNKPKATVLARTLLPAGQTDRLPTKGKHALEKVGNSAKQNRDRKKKKTRNKVADRGEKRGRREGEKAA